MRKGNVKGLCAGLGLLLFVAGCNDDGKSSVEDDWVAVTDISMAGGHMLALGDDGIVRSVGDIHYLSQEAVGDAPVGLTDVVAVQALGQASVAIHGNGTLTAWGYPELVEILENLTNIKAISSSGNRVSALHTDNSLTLIYGTSVSYYPPFDQPIIKSDGHYLLTDKHVLYSIQFVDADEFEFVKSLDGVKDFSVDHVILDDGTVTTFDALTFGWEVDEFSLYNDYVKITSTSEYRRNFVIALRANGKVVTTGDPLDYRTPVPTDLDDVVDIAASFLDCFLVLKSNGEVVQWGSCPDVILGLEPELNTLN